MNSADHAAPADDARTSVHQEEFESKYITANQICQRLQISRPALQNVQARMAPPIVIPGARISIWIRTEVEEFLSAWETMLKARRGGNT